LFNIIDRYIARLFLGYFIGGLLVFVTLYLAMNFMTFTFGGAGAEADMPALFRYYGYLAPEIIYQMIPVACLMATLFTLSTLQRSNELVALLSMGTSLFRICVPILSIVIFISLTTFWLSDRVLPRLAQKKNYVLFVEIRKKPGLYSTVKTNKIWYRTENVLFNIKTLNADQAKAQGLTLYYFDSNWDLIQLITAQDVDMKEGKWDLKKGTVTLFTKESSFPLTRTFVDKEVSMNEDVSDLKSSSDSSAVMSLGELGKFIRRNKEAGLDTVRYEVDYHSKFGFAFAAFVMSVMGIPFSVSRKPRSGGFFVNVGLCLLLAFLYWSLYSSSLTLGSHGQLPPLLAAWAPNLLILLVSFVFFLRLKK